MTIRYSKRVNEEGPSDIQKAVHTIIHNMCKVTSVFFIFSFYSNRVVEIGRLSAKTIHATHYLKFSVKITTNQLHHHFRKKVPFLKKKVSQLSLEYYEE